MRSTALRTESAAAHVRLLVAERRLQQRPRSRTSIEAAALLQAEPLVGVEGGRVGALDPLEQRAGAARSPPPAARRRRRRAARRRVPRRRRRFRRSGRRRRSAWCRRWRPPRPGPTRLAVGGAAPRRARSAAHPPVARPIGRSGGRSPSRSRRPRPPGRPSGGPRPSSRRRPGARRSPSCRQPGSARSRATRIPVRLEIMPAAGEGALGRRESRRTRPPTRTACSLDQVRGAGGDREVDVIGGRQRLRQHPDLEPGRADVAEVERPRRRVRLVEDAGRVGEHLRRVDRELGQRPAASRSRRSASIAGSSGPRALERVPGVGDQRVSASSTASRSASAE